MQKCEKIKKESKNHNSKIIDPTEFCMAPSEREKLALSELLISCIASFGPQNCSTSPNHSQDKGKTTFLCGTQKVFESSNLRLFSKIFNQKVKADLQTITKNLPFKTKQSSVAQSVFK